MPVRITGLAVVSDWASEATDPTEPSISASYALAGDSEATSTKSAPTPSATTTASSGAPASTASACVRERRPRSGHCAAVILGSGHQQTDLVLVGGLARDPPAVHDDDAVGDERAARRGRR